MRARFMRYASRTTRNVLESFTRNQELIAVLTAQWGDYGLPPSRSSFGMHAILAHHYLGGGFYPVGGARTMAGVQATLHVHGLVRRRVLVHRLPSRRGDYAVAPGIASREST